MSGAGRRTIHRETGSGGWPNGLTVDYLEKRILWIDARSAPAPRPGGLHPPLLLRDRVEPRVPGPGSHEGGEKARGSWSQSHTAKGPGRGLSERRVWAGEEVQMEEGRGRAAPCTGVPAEGRSATPSSLTRLCALLGALSAQGEGRLFLGGVPKGGPFF